MTGTLYSCSPETLEDSGTLAHIPENPDTLLLLPEIPVGPGTLELGPGNPGTQGTQVWTLLHREEELE